MTPTKALELQPTKKKRESVQIPDQLNYPINANLKDILLNDTKLTEDVIRACVDGEIVETMSGASTVTLNLVDRNRTLVHSKLLTDWVNTNDPPSFTVSHGQRRNRNVPIEWRDIFMTMDGRDFALVRADKTGDNFDLEFENRAVYEMRKWTSPRAWPRSTFTRAQVIKAMCDEVRRYHIPYYSPELLIRQPITSALSKLSEADKKKLKLHGFAPGAKVTVKHAAATSQQKSYIGRVLSTGESMAAPYQVLLASLMTITQESGVTIVTNSSGHVGLFQQDPRYWPATGTNIEKDAAAYFKAAIDVYNKNPGIAPDQIGIKTEEPYGNFPNPYQPYKQWEDEAKKTLKLWGAGAGSGSQLFTEFSPYNFQRGQAGQREDSWTAGQRFAQEVLWRLFMVDNTCFFMNDIDLINQIALDTISETHAGIDSIDYSIDTGKEITQATVTAHLSRWGTPPGSVVVIEDSGPADGPWLVWEVRRPLFSNISEVTLQRPSPPKPEPAPDVVTSSTVPKGSGGPLAHSGNKDVDAVYAKAVSISNQNYPYAWGGGHVQIGVPSIDERGGSQVGYDCSGYVSACLHAAGWLDTPLDSGSLMNWGDPGPGKLLTVYCNPTHAFIHFEDFISLAGGTSNATQFVRADTVPDANAGPPPSGNGWVHVWKTFPGPEGDPPMEGGTIMIPRHWPGT